MANWNLKKKIKKMAFVVGIEIQVSINTKNTEHVKVYFITYSLRYNNFGLLFSFKTCAY